RFAAALISPRTWREFRIKSDRPRLCSSDRDRQRLAFGRSLPFSAPACPGLFFYSVHNGAGGKKQESHWAWQPSGSSHLMPHGVDWPAPPYLNLAQRQFQSFSFPSCFPYLNPANQLATGQHMPPSSCSPVASVKDCL